MPLVAMSRWIALRLFAAYLSLAMLVSCSQKTAVEAPDLIVLQTGRLRGNVVPEGVKGSLQSFPYIAGYVKQVREEARRTHTPVVLVDLGDSLTGSFASEVTRSANVVSFFNDLKYDAVMLGNLDADVPSEALKALKMPVLCPFQTPDGQSAMAGTKFSATVAKEGLQVQLLANFYGDVQQAQYPERFPNFFGSAEEVSPFRDYEGLVKALPAPGEKTVRLFQWMKFEHEGTGAPEWLAYLKKISVDLVLAHRVYGREKTDAWVSTSTYDWKPPVSLNILRNNRGFALARADLKRVNGKWVLKKQQILPMVSNTAPAEEAVERDLKPFAKKIVDADRLVAQAEKDVDADGILQRYLAALASVPGTTAAVYSPQSVRSGWPKGEIRVSDIYSCLPWAKGLVQFEVTAEQYAGLRADKNLRVYAVPSPDSAALQTVTTSEFLARVAVQRLGLDRSKIRPVVTQPEYEFFATFLRQKADPSLNLNEPTGWKLEAAR